AGGDRLPGSDPTRRMGASGRSPVLSLLAFLTAASGVASGIALSDFRARLCQACDVAVTVLIVDDHPTFRRFARRMLEQAGFQVVGEAEDGAAGIAAGRDPGPPAGVLRGVL